MRTIKTITTLMLAASLGAGVNLVSEAAVARDGDHQEHGDHQVSAARGGNYSSDTSKRGKSKPGQAGAVTWGGSPPRSPAPAGKGLHIRGDTTSRTPVSLEEPIANGAPIHGGIPPKSPVSIIEPITNGAPINGGSPPKSPVATTSPAAPGAPAGAAVVSNGQVKLYIPNSPSGLSVTSDKPGTVTVSNGDPSHSVTLPGGSVTISGGGAVNSVGAGSGIQVVSHPNGDFVAAANAPPTRTTVTGGPEGGFINALGNGLVDTGKDIAGTLNPVTTFKGEAKGDNIIKDPPTSTSVQR